ncbi:hypothetical protein [Bradyrhizobium tropiciagri]|uniref:hypothetical protein n=1 Tax=Bradyrhizobium tropiciagri TaxID=312253 RepID=UPI00067C0E64|nr:hypothetical protein [Bradyrhizobium tropiciagri]
MTIADRSRIAGRNQIVGNTAPDPGASILEHGDDAAHCSNGLNAQRFRDAPPGERAIYQRWIRGAIVSCVVLALAAGVAVWINGGNAGQTQLTSLSSSGSAKSGHTP